MPLDTTHSRINGKPCSGPCLGRRDMCPSPDACHLEEEDGNAIKGVMVAMAIITALAFIGMLISWLA